jgi:hypothetical protein
MSGWPAVSVGTFGGRVHVVDPADELGKFRVLVTPERKYETDSDWPAPTLLRQGVQANGWVMLRNVSLGWEAWRRLNGFPPSRELPSDSAAKADGGGKKK